MSIFEQASRQHIRFDSPKGLLTVEDLWEVPLTSTAGKPNLDDIAKALDKQLRESSAVVSFVTPSSANNTLTQLQFDVVKHIIDVRVAERNKAKEESVRREKKQRILEIIAKKEDSALEGASLEDLRKMAEEL